MSLPTPPVPATQPSSPLPPPVPSIPVARSAPNPAFAALDPRFTKGTYVIRRQVFTLLHKNFHIYDPDNTLVLYGRQKGFKLKEDLRFFDSEAMTTELIRIQARSIIDFGASYDIYDARTNTKVGVARRKGLKSMLRDEWEILSPTEQLIATLREDSTVAALVRRFIEIAALFLPQTFIIEVNGVPTASFKQNLNPFVRKLEVDLTRLPASLDPRLMLGTALLIAAIEGRQN